MAATVQRRTGASRRTGFSTLIKRLSNVGFKTQFVRSALLPEWWDKACDEDVSLLPEVEIRVARFLGIPLSHVQDSSISLAPRHPLSAKLRRVGDVDSERLRPAIHTAIKIAESTVRCLGEFVPRPEIPPPSGLEWRGDVGSQDDSITLDTILGDLWGRGIPVIPLDIVPAPSFQAIACIAEDRPVILIGQKNDEPGRIAFWVAHEVGHIARGDCDTEHLILDGQEGILDESDIEKNADKYSRQVLVGDNLIPEMGNGDFREIAKESARLSSCTGIGAGMIISAWASRTGDYSKAQMALKALYLATGARKTLSRHFAENIDLEGAPETDRDILRCVLGVTESYEAPG